jgi:hypothetical protein
MKNYFHFKFIFGTQSRMSFMNFQSIPGGYKADNSLNKERNHVALSRSTRGTDNGVQINAEVSNFVIHTMCKNKINSA